MNELDWDLAWRNIPIKFDRDPRRIAPGRVVMDLEVQNHSYISHEYTQSRSCLKKHPY